MIIYIIDVIQITYKINNYKNLTNIIIFPYIVENSILNYII